METGTAGLYVAGHGSQAVWDGKGDEKRAEGRGRGACVGFVVSDRCPPMFGEIFLLLFFNGLGRRVGRTLMRYKKRSNTTKNNKLSAMDDDVDDDDIVMRWMYALCVYACCKSLPGSAELRIKKIREKK